MFFAEKNESNRSFHICGVLIWHSIRAMTVKIVILYESSVQIFVQEVNNALNRDWTELVFQIGAEYIRNHSVSQSSIGARTRIHWHIMLKLGKLLVCPGFHRCVEWRRQH